jgi:hypothetical protein
MNWQTNFCKPIRLKDGRTMATLGEARSFIHTLPRNRRHNAYWSFAAEQLTRASEAASLVDDALTHLQRALKVDELI